jgi:CheY-like chemotaxis protein
MHSEIPLLQVDSRNMAFRPWRTTVVVSERADGVVRDAWGVERRLRTTGRVWLYQPETTETGERDDLLLEGTTTFDAAAGQWEALVDNTLIRRRSEIGPTEPHWSNAINWEAVFEGEAEARRVSRHRRKRLALVVDDEPGVLVLLQQILQTLGFDVQSAANGREALRQAEQRAPDLVLLDALMPELDGEGFLKERLANPRLATVPTIVVSGYPDMARPTSIKYGASGFLAKPFGLDDLRTLLENVVTA